MPRTPRMKTAKKAQNLKSSGPSSVKGDTPKKEGEAKLIKYGTNDRMPHEIIDALCASGTARWCWKMIDAFIQADGFSDVDEAELEINANRETADNLLDKVSLDFAALDGFALRILYAVGGTVGEVYHVPFQTVRKMDDGTFIVNPTYGSKQYKKDQDEIVPGFNPDEYQESIATAVDGVEGSQKGQIWYVYRSTTDAPVYPVPDFWTEAGRLDIETDVQISKSDNKTLKKNFQPPFIAYIPGLDSATKDPDTGKTQVDYAAEDIADMVNPDNEGEPIVLTGATKEETPQLVAWDNSKNLLGLDAKRDTIGRQVCRHFGFPPVLAGFSTAGQLGNNQEILNAISLLQNNLNRKQRQIQRVFKKLFPQGEWTISTLNVLQWLPSEMLAIMTEDEKRNFLGLAPLEAQTSNEAEKTLQALNTLSPLVANKVLESMSMEEIRGLIGLKGTVEPQPNQDNADNQS